MYAVSDSGAVSFRQNLIRSQSDVTSASRTLQYDPQLNQEIFLALRSADCAEHAGFSGAVLSASHISMDKGITRTGFRVGTSGSRGSIVAIVPALQVVGPTCTDRPGGCSGGRSLLRKAKTRAVFVVVAGALREQPFPMKFIESDDGFQQVASAAKEHSITLLVCNLRNKCLGRGWVVRSEPGDPTEQPDIVPGLAPKDRRWLGLRSGIDACIACITDCENCIIARGPDVAEHRAQLCTDRGRCRCHL